MEVSRFLLYASGFVLSVMVVAQLLRLRHALARMLAAMMGVWALNCLVLLVNLAVLLDRGALPRWGSWAFTANAALLALGPLGLLLWFARYRAGGDGP